jgi:hypothetical protein
MKIHEFFATSVGAGKSCASRLAQGDLADLAGSYLQLIRCALLFFSFFHKN